MESIWDEIQAERKRQDEQWGGPAHDDQHGPFDWFNFIKLQMDRKFWRSIGVLPSPITEAATAPFVRARLVKIAALAQAGIESIDRQAAPVAEGDGS